MHSKYPLPKTINELDKVLVFLEANTYFIDKIDYDEWIAYCVVDNKIIEIAILNNFIREYNIKLSPEEIYRNIGSIGAIRETKELEKYFGSVCVKYDTNILIYNAIKEYPNLFNK